MKFLKSAQILSFLLFSSLHATEQKEEYKQEYEQESRYNSDLDNEEEETHQITNPMVLITGASIYDKDGYNRRGYAKDGYSKRGLHKDGCILM